MMHDPQSGACHPAAERAGGVRAPITPPNTVKREDLLPVALPNTGFATKKGLGSYRLSHCFIGAPCATRTHDHLIKSQMLYQLS